MMLRFVSNVNITSADTCQNSGYISKQQVINLSSLPFTPLTFRLEAFVFVCLFLVHQPGTVLNRLTISRGCVNGMVTLAVLDVRKFMARTIAVDTVAVGTIAMGPLAVDLASSKYKDHDTVYACGDSLRRPLLCNQ